MNKNEKRMRAILHEELDKKDELNKQEVCELLGVSESTARRLFDKMEKDKEVIRILGGIRRIHEDTKYLYDHTMEQQRQDKTLIGLYASTLVKDNDFIYIDCGTTTIHLCRFLAERIRKNELVGLTVVTNSFSHLEIMQPCCTTLLAGGTYYPNRKSFAGSICEGFLSQFHFTHAFLGADGFSVSDGFSTSDIETSHLTSVAANLAEETYVLMDSSKLGKRSYVVYDHFEHIHQIITDHKFPNDVIQQLRLMDVDVIIADRENRS